MAVTDRWHKNRPRRANERRCSEHGKYPSSRHGTGKRWRVRWYDPSGNPKAESFDRKADAETHFAEVTSSKRRRRYVDPKAGDITFQDYATKWLASHTYDPNTRQSMELRFRLHAFPLLGSMPLADITPTAIREWLTSLEALAPNYRRIIFVNVSSVFTAAVDDKRISTNPCQAKSVPTPSLEHKKVTPWEFERVCAVRDGLPEQYQITATLAYGLGLRQGEVFGLSPDDVDFLRGHVNVNRQIKIVQSQLVYDLPKFDKTRTVPLPSSIRDALAAHLAANPAREVTLPWDKPGSKPVTAKLVVTSRESKALNRNYFNSYLWKPALVAAGVIPQPKPGERYDPSREHGMHALRHFYASALLDAGESIKAVSEYLGHVDPGFTLRTYTHLMKASDKRVKDTIDALGTTSASFDAGAHVPDVYPQVP